MMRAQIRSRAQTTLAAAFSTNGRLFLFCSSIYQRTRERTAQIKGEKRIRWAREYNIYIDMGLVCNRIHWLCLRCCRVAGRSPDLIGPVSRLSIRSPPARLLIDPLNSAASLARESDLFLTARRSFFCPFMLPCYDSRFICQHGI